MRIQKPGCLIARCVAFALALLCSAAAVATGASSASPPPALADSGYAEALQAISEGRLEDAGSALQVLLASQPEHAGAWLDLALLQCDLGMVQAADRLFQEIETRFAPPVSILEVISKRRQQGCRPPQPSGHWKLRLGWGFDSNINQGASSSEFSLGSDTGRLVLNLEPQDLPTADQYRLLAADYWHQSRSTGDFAYISLQSRQHDSHSEFDTTALLAGLEYPLQLGRQALRVGASLLETTLGGNHYQEQTQIFLNLPALPPVGDRLGTSLLTTASYVRYPNLTHFNSTICELRGQAEYRFDSGYARLGVSKLWDAAHGQRPGGNRGGWQLTGKVVFPGPQQSTGEVGLLAQYWDSNSAYSPGIINEVRQQRLYTLHATWSIPVDRNQTLTLELRQSLNRENIPIFEYESRAIQMGWQWLI